MLNVSCLVFGRRFITVGVVGDAGRSTLGLRDALEFFEVADAPLDGFAVLLLLVLVIADLLRHCDGIKRRHDRSPAETLMGADGGFKTLRSDYILPSVLRIAARV